MKKFKKSVLFAAAAVCLMCAACKDNDDNPPEEVRCDALVPESVRAGDYAAPTAENAGELADKAVKALPAAMEAAVPVIQEALGNVVMPAAEKSVLARMAVSDLGGLVEEFNEACQKFGEDIGTGAASLSFNEAPGTITDLPPYLNLSIPALSVNASASLNQAASAVNAGGSCKLRASGSVDLTAEAFGDSEIKSVSASISADGSLSNLSVNMATESGVPDFSGSLNAGYKAESKVLFVIDGVAGILRATIDYSVKMNDKDLTNLVGTIMDIVNGEDGVDDTALMNVLKDYITVKAVIDVLDINGTLIKTYKETDKIEEILKLFGSFTALSVE